MADITVVIPNYNGIKYLSDCIQALEKERQYPSTPEFEVLIVDDASTDGSLEFLHERFPDVRTISLNKNAGFCHAVNIGIQKSKTPYIILLNNDTKVKSGFIASLYMSIRSKPRIFSVSSQMLMWDKPELIDDAGDYYCALGWAFARGKGRAAAAYNKPAEIFSACGGASIYRTSLFDEIGLFDENHFAYLEDVDIGYRARINGFINLYEPRAKVLHFGSASTGSRYNRRKTFLVSANSVYIIWKNMPTLQLLLNIPLILAGFFIKFLFFCKKKMGRLYLEGLLRGLRRCADKECRCHKVKFKWKNFGNYIIIQYELWINLFRLIAG
ncbi:MAG: glycosyltransferase family 2 protein [Clostridiales bacterium]|nr:glycosyltransferase family 2 protein [Clostridiales bacterium]